MHAVPKRARDVGGGVTENAPHARDVAPGATPGVDPPPAPLPDPPGAPLAIVELGEALRVGIRATVLGDESYILKTWREVVAHRHDYRWARTGEPYKALLWATKLQAEKRLHRFGAIMACAPNDPDYVIGFAVRDLPANVLHMIHVRRELRRMGIGRLLLAGLHMPVACTAWSDDADAVADALGFAYRPSRA